MKDKIDVSLIVEKMLCNACGACAAICKGDAIQYKETVGGHLFPVVDPERCIGCGLCYKVCPSVHTDADTLGIIQSSPFEGTALGSFVGKASDEELYASGQSGGIVSALLLHLFDSQEIRAAVVSTMQPGDPPRPVAFCASSRAQILSSQKSKYCPIPVLSILKEVTRKNLPVALVGLPCHFHGLSRLIHMEPILGELVRYKIGLVCDRVMTYCAIDYLVRQAGCSEKGTVKFNFRDKAPRGYPGTVVVGFSDQDSVVLPDNARMRIKNAFTPARCRVCFDKMNVLSDITVCDPHGLKGIDRRGGESAVIARTVHGLRLTQEAMACNAVLLRGVNYKEIIKGQKISRKRDEWRGYSEVWKGMGMQLPAVFQHLAGVTEHTPADKFLMNLKTSLSLDTYESREALMAAVHATLYDEKSDTENRGPLLHRMGKAFNRLLAGLRKSQES